MKRFGWSAGSFLIFLLIAQVLGTVWPRWTPNLYGTKNSTEIYLISGPIHFDFILPLTPEIRKRFGGVVGFDREQTHMLIGWGSEAFYTTAGQYSDIEAGAVWTAITGDNAVLRMDSFHGFDWEHFKGIRLKLEERQIAVLLDFFEGQFKRKTSGEPMLLEGAGLGRTDRFYEAKGRFYVGNTCNVWVADALQAAGVRIGIWTPTPIAMRASLFLHSNLDWR